MDEVTRQRYIAQIGIFARELVAYNQALTELFIYQTRLDARLHQIIANLERVYGETPETRAWRAQLEQTMNSLSEPHCIPALEAAEDTYDTVATEIGEYVKALGTNSP